MSGGRDLAPTVSVVVPVRNAAATLERCIASIVGQSYPTGLTEVIFVENGSRDASPEILERHRGAVSVLRTTARNAAAARNAGVRTARHRYVAFTDADCEAAPEWIEGLVEAAGRHPEADFVGGRVEALDPRTVVERFETTLHDQRRAIEVYAPPSVATGNCLVVRERLLEVGLFDESFPRGEDSELCYRAGLEHGCRFAFAPRAVVRHANRRTLGALAAMGFTHGQASAHLWHRYAGALGLSRRRRCTSPSSYLEALRPLWSRVGDGGGRHEFALCDAVFRFSKEVGFLAGTLRFR